MDANKKRKFMSYFLGILQAFIGITAIAGGLKLISNPSGIPDFPIEWLSNSPFTNYLIPGLILLIVIGFGNVVAAMTTFLQKRYFGGMAALSGIFLILFMTTEVWFVGLRNFLQPLYFIFGIIVLVLGLKLFKSMIPVHQIEVASTRNKLPA